jgi:hypothetical protein
VDREVRSRRREGGREGRKGGREMGRGGQGGGREKIFAVVTEDTQGSEINYYFGPR